MAISRVVINEMLDDLPPEDPAAQRSRRDLARINALMGNFRWVTRKIMDDPGLRQKLPQESLRIVEIGAGEGGLGRKLAARIPGAEVLGIDRMPPPEDLPKGMSWQRGDLFEALSTCQGDILVGVMILHHFEDGRLSELQPCLANFRRLCFCEPWRSWQALCLAQGMTPVVGPVTRHDMPASIRAGFLPGELSGLLGLDAWQVRETVDWRGSLRIQAWRP